MDIDKDRVGSARNEAIDKLEGTDPEMAEALKGLSPAQRAIGILDGKLIEAKSKSDIIDAWTWYENDPHGCKETFGKDKLDAMNMGVSLLSAAFKLFGPTQEGVNAMIKLYLKMKFT